jgi:hypothetical protein
LDIAIQRANGSVSIVNLGFMSIPAIVWYTRRMLRPPRGWLSVRIGGENVLRKPR